MMLFYKAISYLFYTIEMFIILRAILSFLPIQHGNNFIRFIYDMTEPVLSPCRRLLERIGVRTHFLDFSPVLAILFMQIILYILGRIMW
jgi:YggT family protein